MDISAKLDALHAQATNNRWLRYFTIFNRVALAAGFLPSGFVKIMGERFTSLSNNHPMGQYLEALHNTGYYYTFIGIAQVTAAVLLLIPRTAVMGAMLYFPIILNICILSLAVRFDGSLLSSPLMVLSNLYLLCWYYNRWKWILPFKQAVVPVTSVKFPIKFFAGAAAAVATVVLVTTTAFDILPHNTMRDCTMKCSESENAAACAVFCDAIHQQGKPLSESLDDYHKALQKVQGKK